MSAKTKENPPVFLIKENPQKRKKRGRKRAKTLSLLNRKCEDFLAEAVQEGVFAGAAFGISVGLEKKRIKTTGCCGFASRVPKERKLIKKDFFDIASLTKPLASTLAILCLLKEKKIKTEERLSSFFDNNLRNDIKKITIKQLLSHSSGLPAHKEFHKEIAAGSHGEIKKEIINNILMEPLLANPGKKTLYSDLGYILLGEIVEKRSGASLDSYVAEKVMKPLGLENKLVFLPVVKEKNKSKKKRTFVATENCARRKKMLCGEVHDDNAYLMGGVAGHAGLFGDIASVLSLLGHILDQWQGGGAKHPNLNRQDLRYFLDYGNKKRGARALGFDRPQKTGSSSGRFFSRNSIGHLGFTGCSFWVDPEKELIVVLLSNRVHPDRNNEKIRKFRPRFHDMVIGEIFNTAGVEGGEKREGGARR